MSLIECTSEMELRNKFNCEAIINGNKQTLIVHKGKEKILIPFHHLFDELDVDKAEKISESKYIEMKDNNEVYSKRNNYYFCK